MCKVLVFSTASMKLAVLGGSFLCLATVGCGNMTTATPVSAATAVPSAPVVVAVVANEAAAGAAATGNWGTIKGQVIAGGPVEPLKLLVTKGDAAAKDPTVCAAQDVPDESLVVDAKTGGIANVVVYLQKKPAKVHPDLEKSKEAEVVFDQKGCRFLPQVLLVRTDQQVRVLSDDAIAHNTHTWPLKNNQSNVIITPSDRTGVLFPPLKIGERLPSKISCDIHPWMQAWWVILDHPYAAITKADGTFEIKDLPVGDHEFIVWKTGGYIEKSYKTTVKAGENNLKPIKVPVETLIKMLSK